MSILASNLTPSWQLTDKIGTLLSLRSSVGSSSRGPLPVGQKLLHTCPSSTVALGTSGVEEIKEVGEGGGGRGRGIFFVRFL